jgi:SAM-dependent methyltransferase
MPASTGITGFVVLRGARRPMDIVEPTPPPGFYDRQAANFDRRWCGALGRYFMDVERRHFLAATDYAGKRVLDIGTGSGLFLGLVAGQSAFCLGVDLATEPMLAGREVLLRHFPNVAFAKMDATRLALADRAFDIVTSIGAFERVAELGPVFGNVGRVLSPGGHFVFSVWNADKWMPWRFLDRKLAGSVEHRIADLSRLLADSGMEVELVRSTLFVPRRIFWLIHHALGFRPLRDIYLLAAAKLDAYFSTRNDSRLRGYELIVTARRIS